MKTKTAVFWFRRDLRLTDNCGLFHALGDAHTVLPIFIFDTHILDQLPANDARVTFIYNQLVQIRTLLQKKHNSSLAVYHGDPFEVFTQLLDEYEISTVYTNHDYEPYALTRDKQITELLASKDITFSSYKDQVIFEKNEVLKDDGKPYVVYTPYMKRWRSLFNYKKHAVSFESESMLDNLIQDTALPFPDLSKIGFRRSEIEVPSFDISTGLIDNYKNTRDFPGLLKGTSHLSPHLRFGTISIRQMIQKAYAGKEDTFLKELIWREFFMQILWHYPHTTTRAFKAQYDRIDWRNDPEEFEKWKNGNTGYTMVDAGMRELNATGLMHNRVRMLVASFLCKHLLIDWRWGEAYFAEKLLDYEMSSNVGNWQWAAGSGVDAAPYFRIFNPITQIDKFDKDRSYCNQWVPEANGAPMTLPMVDHKMARERCLHAYKVALS
ncbi:MAG: DNA photolyase family protein [Bacteroidia bacterium]|nr:DNA photolyase family protein [Bacteroidia bacterium]